MHIPCAEWCAWSSTESVHRPTVLMRILCAEWCAWSSTESECTGPQCLCASCAQNDVLEAALSQSAQAHSAYAHPVRRMMRLKQHWVRVHRPTVLMRILCAEWCAWSSTESECTGPQCLCTSCAQNDVLEAALSQCTGPQCLCASCAQNDALEATLSQCTGPQCLCASCAQNDALEATLSHSAQAQCSGVRIEKFKAQRKEILMCSVLNLCHSLLNLFF